MRIHSNALPYADYPTLPVPNASFLLSGTCKLSSISLDAAAYEAAATDKQRVVTLTRSPADVAATVRLDTNDGPAQGLPLFTPALAGVDYTDLTGATSLVSFAAGEAQKTVTLLLRAPTSRAGLNRQMTLTLSEPGASAELGSISTATLRIMAADSTKPTVAITTPAAAGKVRVAADEVTVTGKVGDAKGISRVEMSLNGSEPVPVTLGSWTTPTAIPFSFAITPVNGPNELIVTAWDPRGNSTSLKRSFTFLRLRTLAVRVYDSYTQEPSAFMTLKLATTPSGLAQPWQPATTVEPGMIERKAVIAPGAQVTLTANAPKGHVFSNWDYFAPLSEFDSRLGNQVTFTMPDADTTLLAIQMLREQSFLPTTTVSLHCLLDSSFPGTPALKGYLTGTLSPTGTFSGKFQVQGKSQPVTAVCYDNGPAVFTVAGKKTDALPVPGGKLRLDPGGATYTRDDDGSYSSGFTQLAPFTTANKVPAAWLNSATQGFYTLRLDPQSELTPSAYPRGYGYATAKLTSTGQISITGALPDGTTITCSSVLLDDGTAPVYQPLLTPGGTTKDGLLFGRLQFTQNAETPHITASLKWFRPAAVSPKVLLYAAGWPAGITLDTNGTLYDSKLAVESMLGLTAPGNGLGNASLRLSGGNLVSGITKENFSIVKSAVVKIAPADGSFTLTFTPATGLFSGTFTLDWSNPSSAKPAFKGVILQGTALRGGYGFFLNNAKNEPAPESGVVLLGGTL
ncbi:Ig-like domain-containing protein [Brevifollis gellanilyticus]|uniref:Bacterial repeat domain-containing protein n=1 Tax=Brevifollis gellanilyticus TaxID=748831 RepID=A0A512MAZ5_9BACT|nr:Ig-like domain-containing protein [Brevifollis gellanilyticus]GEP43909.1 hypothetical protein BGE01nite_32000 [Brevifollis gellanilyticus]